MRFVRIQLSGHLNEQKAIKCFGIDGESPRTFVDKKNSWWMIGKPKVLLSFFPLTKCEEKGRAEKSKQQEKITKENIKLGRKAVHPCCCSGEHFQRPSPTSKKNGCKKKHPGPGHSSFQSAEVGLPVRGETNSEI